MKNKDNIGDILWSADLLVNDALAEIRSDATKYKTIHKQLEEAIYLLEMAKRLTEDSGLFAGEFG